jgi:hypothetical protein
MRDTILRPIALFVLAFTAWGSGVTTCFGHGSGGDIAVYSDGSQVAVGFAILDDDDIIQLVFDPNDKVFNSILLPQPPIPGLPDVGSAEPGYDGNENELTPNAPLTVNIQSLMYWNGAGPVSFAPASGVSPSYTPNMANVSPDGGFHAHLIFGLTDTTADALPLPDGVYLAELTATVPGLTESDPYYLVALVDQIVSSSTTPEDDAEAIGELVRAYMEDPADAPAPIFGGKSFAFYGDAIRSVEIPEPATCILAAIAAVGLFVVRRTR